MEVIGQRVAFTYNGKRYKMVISELLEIHWDSWVGDIGWNDDAQVSFIIHGDLDANKQPILSGLSVQYDGSEGEHGYIRIVELLPKFNGRFLENTINTENGVVFKSDEIFDRHNDEVCYIQESGLEALEDADHEMTDEEIIKAGIGESYNSILEQCKETFDEDPEYFIEDVEVKNPEELAESVFCIADWACIGTYLADI